MAAAGRAPGPVVLSARARAVRAAALRGHRCKDGVRLVEHAERRRRASRSAACARSTARWACSCARMSYMLAHGADGMRQASEDAVLNANYVKAGLEDLMSLPFGDRPCMHEVLFDDRWLDGTGVSTLDFAKAMIDEGYHPMTMYFPLVVHGAMLIEPTESESKASLDLFVAALRDLALAAKRGDTARFSGAPYYAPRRRLDETRAARAAGAALGEAGAAERGGGVAAARAVLIDVPSPRRFAGRGWRAEQFLGRDPVARPLRRGGTA